MKLHSLIRSIDSILPSTNLIIAETQTDYQSAMQQIHDSPQCNELSLIPILNVDWVLDTHGKYQLMEYDTYRWRRGIFSSLSFFLYEFKRDYAKVKQCIEANDGRVVATLDDAVYIVCTKTVDTDIFKDDRAVSAKWLRSCTKANRLVPRNEKVLYRPFPRLLKDKTLCLTGFRKEDQLTMADYVESAFTREFHCRALGGMIGTRVQKEVYALICQDLVKTNVKIQEAKTLGVPIVKRTWLDWLIVHVVSTVTPNR